MSIWVVVDVEADGPAPGIDLYSMVCFGAVALDRNLERTFYAKTAPISEKFIPDALKVSGFTREQHLEFPKPEIAMHDFRRWLNSLNDRVVFVSDNPIFEGQFMNHYFHKFVGENPFGHSGRRIGDMYAGLLKDVYRTNEFKRLRKTKHTHDPVDDAKGNAEALQEFNKQFGFNAPIK